MRGRRGPGLIVLLVQRQANAHHPALAAGLVHDGGDLLCSQAAQRRQERPLILVRFEALVEEHAVMSLARAALQGQRDEVAESVLGERVLARKESVVGFKTDVRVTLHRFGEQVRTEAAGEGRGHRLGEEDPDMPAVAGAGAFQCRRHAL